MEDSKSEIVATSLLKPYKNNSRKHSKEQIDKIINSIKAFGFTKPITTWHDNQIVTGHGTWMAAQQMGLQEVPIRRLDHLTETEMRAYVIADNKLSDESSFDSEILLEELTALCDLEFKIELTGFDMDFLGTSLLETGGFDKNGQADDDEPEDDRDESERAAEIIDREIIGDDDRNLNPRELEPDEEINALPEKYEKRVSLGDIWHLGDHRLICGDSTDPENIRKLFEDRTAAFCFTSPPYADQRTYNGGKELSTEKLAKFISLTSDCVELFAVNLGLSRKDSDIQCYWDDYIAAARESGMKLLSWNIWDKIEAGTVGAQKTMFATSHEWIFVFGKKRKDLNKTLPNKTAGEKVSGGNVRWAAGHFVNNPLKETKDFSNMRTVLQLRGQRGNNGTDHPAVFPVELPRVYIEACTNPGDTVYEPFGGSGTTLIACEESERICLISELDPGYCNMILARWENLTGNKAELYVDSTALVQANAGLS